MEHTMKLQRRLLVLMRAMRMFLISMPIIVIYWQDHGLLVRDIFILQVIFSVALIVFEIPSGYLADKYGRVLSIKIGSVMSTLGFLMYWLWPGFAGFVLAELLLAFGSSTLSGSVEALLNESIAPHERKTLNRKWQSRLLMFGNISEAVAAIAAGLVAAWFGLTTVLLVQVIVFATSMPFSWWLIETRQTHEVQTPTLLKIIKGSFYENKRLQALNVYTAGLSAATLTVVWFTQPHWRDIGVNTIYFGYLWSGLQLCVALGSATADRLERRLTFRTLFATAGGLMVTGYVLMSILSTSLWSLIVIPLFWLIRGVTYPLIIDYVQQESGDEEKATVLSINKLGTRLVFSAFSPFLGWTVDLWSFEMAFLASAVVFGTISSLGLFLLFRSYHSVRPTT